MEIIINYIAKEWQVIGQAPATFLTAALLLAAAAYAAASWRFGGIIAIQIAQIELLERRVSAQPGGGDYEKRKVTVDKLGAFLARGNAIMLATRGSFTPAQSDDAQKWLGELLDFLSKELGSAYVARVNDGGSAPVGFGGTHIYNEVRIRVYHLQEFLKELARP